EAVEMPGPVDGERDEVGQSLCSEQDVVTSGGFPALARPGVEMPDLDAQDGGLDGIEPRVEADLVVVVLGLHAVDAGSGQLATEHRVVGRHESAVAETAQVLGRVEAEGRRLAEAAGAASPVGGADGLGRVF